MTFFDQIVLSNQAYIDVGGGCLWAQVYAAMENSGKNVVGGHGGVAGFLLGGGYSLLSNQYGLAIDHILEMEVVLPGGKVMTVKEDGEGSDLFEALKVLLVARSNSFNLKIFRAAEITLESLLDLD